MTRPCEIITRVDNLGFYLRLLENDLEIAAGSFPVHDRYKEAQAFDDAMADAEAWVLFGRDYRAQSQRERLGQQEPGS